VYAGRARESPTERAIVNITLPTPETEVTDFYRGLSLVVPAAKSRSHKAYEVRTVKVTLTVLDQDDPEGDAHAGDVFADVMLHGYPLGDRPGRAAGLVRAARHRPGQDR
jgi:hypothetical protein